MKKYVIKNADGSEQHEVPAVHNTHKEAMLALLQYITGVKPNTDFHVVKKKLSESAVPLEGVSRLVEDINPRNLEALDALNKLFTIADAWNMMDVFVPDFENHKQTKHFPWFKYNEDVAGFVYIGTYSTAILTGAYLGSRLCFKTSERAKQFGKQFADLYNKAFLPPRRNRRR